MSPAASSEPDSTTVPAEALEGARGVLPGESDEAAWEAMAEPGPELEPRCGESSEQAEEPAPGVVVAQGGAGRPASNALLVEIVDGLVGAGGVGPSGTRLFRALAGPEAMRNGWTALYDVVGRPSTMLAVELGEGDILVRRARGEGLTHCAVIADPRQLEPAAARREGLRLEGPAPGRYVHVVEGGPRPHGLQDRFARRIADSDGRLDRDTLVLRPRSDRRLQLGGLDAG